MPNETTLSSLKRLMEEGHPEWCAMDILSGRCVCGLGSRRDAAARPLLPALIAAAELAREYLDATVESTATAERLDAALARLEESR